MAFSPLDSPLSHVSYPDTGYTKICGTCCTRWEEDVSLIGKSRIVEFATCAKCLGHSSFRRRVTAGEIPIEKRPILN